uniref:Odorant receptor n=2 Tax=Diabrotica virgifera virgifera TaxID=50390 RepID=A0A6P7FZK9_DIAVI
MEIDDDRNILPDRGRKEDDPFYWILDWGTLLSRTLLQNTITTLHFCCHVGLFGIVLLHAWFIVPTNQELLDHLLTGAFGIYIIVGYGSFMNHVDMTMFAVNLLKNVYNGSGRPISDTLKKSIFKFSHTVKRYLSICIVVMTVVFLTVMLSMDHKKQLYYKIIKDFFQGRIAALILFLMFIMPHSLMFCTQIILINCYFSSHSYYCLKALNEQIEILIDFEMDAKTSSYHSPEYQKRIRRDMIYFSTQLEHIKMAINYYRHFMQWRFFMMVFTAGAVLGALLINILVLKPRDAMPYVILTGLGIQNFYVLTETGQYLENESETIYMNATRFKWFQWDRSNRTLLLNFLLQTKRPLSFNCYRIIYQNRALLLLVFRMLHLYTAFYNGLQPT